MFRVCIDVGGTFTDCVICDSEGNYSEYKSPSTPGDFSLGVINAISEAASAYKLTMENFLKDTEVILHGSTVATNALITRKLAKTALITTMGFRDIIETRCSLKAETKSIYDFFIPPYEPIVPRYLRFGISEATRNNGEIITPVAYCVRSTSYLTRSCSSSYTQKVFALVLRVFHFVQLH